MTRNQKIIIGTAAGISLAATILIICLFYHSIKQSIMGAITKNYFSDAELMESATAKKKGIDNTPTASAWANLHALRDNILNPAREALGNCIYINCAYRSPKLNALIGGSSTSQHMNGCAADITTRSKEGNRKLFAILIEMSNFDQLIWEGQGSWIHVSYDPVRDRQSVLAQNADGKTYSNIKNNWQDAIA